MEIPHVEVPNKTFRIVQVGTGGNGGYLVQRLTKMLYALSQTSELSYEYIIVDGDLTEHKNILRQPFIEEDVGEFKTKVLAERYGNTYGISISYKDSYIESVQDLYDVFRGIYDTGILIGCVDNHATRKIMHEFFHNCYGNLIYLDSGIDSVLEDEPYSGYSGVVACGVKYHNEVILPPVGDVYTDILTDATSRLPTESCGENVVNHPQRMMTNEMAALVMAGYLNNILGNHMIVSHYTNFNAMTLKCNPVYLTKEQLSLTSL